jgi:enoyl-CoA hydratase
MPEAAIGSVIKLIKNEGQTATVLFCDARKGNPMGPAFWEELPKVFEALEADDSIRAVVLASEQANFSFGLDLVGMGAELMPAVLGGATGRATIARLGKKLQQALNTIASCSKPTVAAVSGYCIGGGVELLAACDVRVCDATAKFSLREVRMGMVCDLGGIQRLPFIVGEGNARLLALTGMDIDAAQALTMGLVTEVLKDAASALAAAQAIAAQIASNPPKVVSAVKAVMNARTQASVTAGLEHALLANTALMQSGDFQEAIAAFMEKRQAKFTGQ